jgi:tetratricopeptide (TPR) repeat protein
MGLTEDPILLATWGEGLSLLGVETDKVQLIQEGQEKIEEALTIDSSNPLFWKAFGESFHALGLYFEELDYHYLAVEKLQEGLSLDRTQDTLWQSLAHIYMHIGVATEDLEELKKSLYFHQKAIDLKSNESSYLYSKACCLSRMGELSRQESYLSEALAYFEKALQMKKHTLHLHPDWLFEYAKCLDLFADFFEEEHFYHKAIELFLHVLVAEPDYPKIYHRLGLAYSHLAELSHEVQNFHRAVYFFKLALKRNHEDDQVLVDFAISLINLADHSHETSEIEAYFEEAKRKLFLAAQAGNGQAYYQLACLFSLNHDIEKSIFFLRKAENCLTLPSVGELLEDDWLDHVRSSPDFSQFLQELEKKINLKEDS